MKFSDAISMTKLMKPCSLAIVVLLLAACSGGSGGGGSDRVNDPSADPNSGGFVYSGPAPASAEIQSFKINFYDPLAGDDRCGACHTPGGSGTRHFVNRDDVNEAWRVAKSVVNLTDPSLSSVVQRVGSGHNCWLGSGADATCAVTVQSFVERWAAGNSQAVNTVTLLPRNFDEPKSFKPFPESYQFVIDDPDLNLDLKAGDELLEVLERYCSGCHSETGELSQQQPYFASSDPEVAFQALRGKISLSDPALSRSQLDQSQSRVVQRPYSESHQNCGDCVNTADEIQQAINKFAGLIDPVDPDPDLAVSAAQSLLRDGIVASTGGRAETDVIAKWEFREGEGITVADTSGVSPAIVLTVIGDHEWMGGWGMRFDGGRGQGSVSSSKKLNQLISATGEYSVEAWVAPFNVSQEDAWIFGYSGSSNLRNTLMAQTLYNYDFYTRSSATADNGAGDPLLATADGDELAQATQQHVVMTFDPINGRKIYVNGADAEVVDESGGGLINNWNEAFAVTLGDSVAGDRPWQGAIRMLAVHNRALSAEQVAANNEVGVGQKYYMMFSVAEQVDDFGNCHTGSGSERIDYCYIVFEVSEFDDASYLFARPTFVNINPSPRPLNFTINGLRLGINSQLALVGQGFGNLRVTVDSGQFGDVGFTQQGQLLSQQGTVIAKEFGTAAAIPDLFFLAFGEISGNNSSFDDGVDQSGSYSFTGNPDSEAPDLTVRSFDEINQSFSVITGVDSGNAAVVSSYGGLKQALPSLDDFQAYMSSHIMAATQLAAVYCSELVKDTVLRGQVFNAAGGVDWGQNVSSYGPMAAATYWQDRVAAPLLNRAMNSDAALATEAARLAAISQIGLLITDGDDNHPYSTGPDGKKDGLMFCENNNPCPDSKTAEVVAGACTAILGSGVTIIH